MRTACEVATVRTVLARLRTIWSPACQVNVNRLPTSAKRHIERSRRVVHSERCVPDVVRKAEL